MINIGEVIETNKMIEQENFDVRTITMGINVLDSHPCTCRREPRRSSHDQLALEYEQYREKKREPML